MAEASTGDRVWEEWFATIHEYAFARFPDRVNGEWFGYLRRDGSVANTVKGNHYKVCFHIPRFMLMALESLDEIAACGQGRVLIRHHLFRHAPLSQ